MPKTSLKFSRIVVPIALIFGILSSTIARTLDNVGANTSARDIVSPLR